jgi:hypothetical protein
MEAEDSGNFWYLSCKFEEIAMEVADSGLHLLRSTTPFWLRADLFSMEFRRI